MVHEALCVAKARKPPGLVEVDLAVACGSGDMDPGPVGGAEVAAQSDPPARLRHVHQLVEAFSPGTVDLRGDGHEGRNAVQGKLRQGEFADRGALGRREHVPATVGEVVLRPEVASGDIGRGPRVKDEVIDVGEGVQIYQARHDQTLAIVALLIDRAFVIAPHEDDGISLEDDFAVLDERVPCSVEPQNVPGRDFLVHTCLLARGRVTRTDKCDLPLNGYEYTVIWYTESQFRHVDAMCSFYSLLPSKGLRHAQ